MAHFYVHVTPYFGPMCIVILITICAILTHLKYMNPVKGFLLALRATFAFNKFILVLVAH